MWLQKGENNSCFGCSGSQVDAAAAVGGRLQQQQDRGCKQRSLQSVPHHGGQTTGAPRQTVRGEGITFVEEA